MNSNAAAIDPLLPFEFPADFKRRAWLTAFMATLGTMCCSTSVILVNVGVFMKPLADTFGWSRGSIALSLSIAAVVMALANPLVGRLIDRFGVRPVLIGSLVAYGCGTALLPVLVGAANLLGLYIGYALIAGLGAGSNVIAYVRLLSGWFSGPMNNSRGLALGLSSSGIPLGAAVSGPAGVLLIEHFGWGGGYLGLSMMPLVIGLPIAFFGVRQAPQEVRKAAALMEPEYRSGLSMTEVSRTPTFWLMIVIVFLMSTCLNGITIHIAPLLSDLHLSPEGVAFVLAAEGILGIAARIGAGFLFDRFFAPRVSMLIFGLAAVSAFAMVGYPGLTVAIVATMLITAGSGAESDLIGYLVGRYFGLRCYGQIFGYIYGMFMVGIAVGPYLFGLAFDTWGDYRVPFCIAGVGMMLLCGLLLLLPRFPDEATFDEQRREEK